MSDSSILPPLNADRAPRGSGGTRMRGKEKSRDAMARPGWRSDLSNLMKGQTSLLRMVGRRIFKRPIRSIGIAAGMGLFGFILVNAMMLQNERHPSPFFAVAPSTVLAPANVPLPPARPARPDAVPTAAETARQMGLVKDLQAELSRRGFYVGQIDGYPNSRLDIAIREFEKAASIPVTGEPTEKLLTLVSASKLTMKDQLLVLIRDSTSNAGVDRSKTNIAVQKALNKLNYGPMREDGVFGGSTKAAIEQFERDHKLSVRGEPNGRFLKELSAAAGMAIE